MQKKYYYLSFLLSIFILFLNIIMIPQIDMPKADPFFHISITPVIYWIGFIFTIIFILWTIFFYEKIKISSFFGLSLLIILSFYIYVLPRFFYVNPIYTDTYIFVAEMIYVINNGHIGVGHSIETPGLSLLSSQYSLITGIDHIIVAQIFQYFFSLMTIIVIYLMSTFFTNKRTALLSSVFFISIHFYGIYFNRQSFSLMLQIFIYLYIFKYYYAKNSYIQLSLLAVVLSYTSLVISHPLSSLLMSISLILIFVFLNIYNYFNKIYIHNLKYDINLSSNVAFRSLFLSIIFIIIWLFWNLNTYKNFDLLIRTIIQTISQLYQQPNPTMPAQSFISGYQKSYSPIINLRLSAFIYEILVAFSLLLYSIFKNKKINNSIIIFSWFMGCIVIAPAGLYTGHFFDRTFLHAIPVFSIILSWYIFFKTPSINLIKKINKKSLFNNIKIILLFINIIYLILLPLSMYTVSPFFYPPSSYLAESDYLTERGIGRISMIPGDSVLGYYTTLNNATDAILRFPPGEEEIVATNFRTYTKSAFITESPEYFERIKLMEKGYINNTFYHKIFDSDKWHRIYYKTIVAK